MAPGDQLVMVTDGLYEWKQNGGVASAWASLVDLIKLHREEGGEALWNVIQGRIHAALPDETDPLDDQTLLVWERRA